MLALDWEMRDIADIEASGTNYNVQLMEVCLRLNTSFSDLEDRRLRQCNIRQ